MRVYSAVLAGAVLVLAGAVQVEFGGKGGALGAGESRAMAEGKPSGGVIVGDTDGVVLAGAAKVGQGAAAVAGVARPGAAGRLLGSPDFYPSPARPLGWRGDWTGRFPGATPPMDWSRRVKGVTSELRYQALKPTGDPGAGSFQMEYFTIKDWLVAGPFAVEAPAKWPCRNN